MLASDERSTRRRLLRSPFAPVVLPLGALVAWATRWVLQDSHNIYTALSKRFYVPDPDLGWRVSTQHPIWVGLDVGAVILAIAVAVGVGGILVRRRERARGTAARGWRGASWLVAAVPLAVPILAFASGPGPLHGRDTLPASVAVMVDDGIEGALDAPSGRYVVVAHAGTAVTAHLSAGREVFDARFAGDLRGEWRVDPRDLTRPMHAEISVAAASVDTGVAERSKHAREGYLHADQFPRIVVTIDRVAAVRSSGRDEVVFRAPGTVQLMGRMHAVSITGTLQRADAAALGRLGLTGDVLLVQADCSLVITETALAPDAGDFDGERIPIHASLVVRHAGD